MESMLLSAALPFVRFTAFFVVSPFPGSLVPPTVRIILASTLAWAFSSVEQAMTKITIASICTETIVGLVMGFFMLLVFSAFAVAGEASGNQMGLGALNTFNVALLEESTITATVFSTTALLVFAVGGGPERMMILLSRSLELLPPGNLPHAFKLPEISQQGIEMFRLGLRAASPVIAAVFVAQGILAILARAVPTLNLFVEGPAFTVSSGIFGLFCVLDSFSEIFFAAFDTQAEQLSRWLSV